MGCHSAIQSADNITKTVAHLPNYLCNMFYKEFKRSDIDEYKVDLLKFSHWLDERLSEAHNAIALIIKLKKNRKKNLKNHPKNIRILIEYIHFERTIKTIRPIKKTLRLYVGYIQEIIKCPTAKN